jgi:hypothetical protein
MLTYDKQFNIEIFLSKVVHSTFQKLFVVFFDVTILFLGSLSYALNTHVNKTLILLKDGMKSTEKTLSDVKKF